MYKYNKKKQWNEAKVFHSQSYCLWAKVGLCWRIFRCVLIIKGTFLASAKIQVDSKSFQWTTTV